MKSFFILIFMALCIGCQTPAVIGPTPNINPSKTSNAATQNNIANLKSQIQDLRAALKEAQKSGQEGDKNLQVIGNDLNQLMKGQ